MVKRAAGLVLAVSALNLNAASSAALNSSVDSPSMSSARSFAQNVAAAQAEKLASIAKRQPKGDSDKTEKPVSNGQIGRLAASFAGAALEAEPGSLPPAHTSELRGRSGRGRRGRRSNPKLSSPADMAATAAIEAGNTPNSKRQPKGDSDKAGSANGPASNGQIGMLAASFAGAALEAESGSLPVPAYRRQLRGRGGRGRRSKLSLRGIATGVASAALEAVNIVSTSNSKREPKVRRGRGRKQRSSGAATEPVTLSPRGIGYEYLLDELD